jgi:hypothetical protein
VAARLWWATAYRYCHRPWLAIGPLSLPQDPGACGRIGEHTGPVADGRVGHAVGVLAEKSRPLEEKQVTAISLLQRFAGSDRASSV